MTDTTKPDKTIMTIEYNGITYRFSHSAFEGTKASPIYAAVSLPDGRELIYSMWNQGKLGFRYLRRNGCSTCALTCVLSTLVNPSITPQKVLFGRMKILSPMLRAPIKPINIAAIVLTLRQYMEVDCLDGGSDDDVRDFICTRAKAGVPVIATATNVPSLYGVNLANKAVHTFVIIGMKDERTVITLDSSSYNDQRVKFVDIDALVQGVIREGLEYGLAHRRHFYSRYARGGLVAPKELTL